MPTDDQIYFRERAAQERQAAQRSSCMVREVHEEFAELYAARAGEAQAGRPRRSRARKEQ